MTAPPHARPDSPAEDRPGGISAARIRLGRMFRAESANYFTLLGTTIFLVVFGLVMVLSSSTVDSYIADEGFFGEFMRQGVFVLVGIPLMLVVSRLPQRFWMAVAWPALAIACGLQVLVVATPMGVTVGGNTNWLNLGGFQFQPSEAIKLALVLWLGLMTTRKEPVLGEFGRGVLPILLIGGGAIGLVLLGGDLGTVMIMGGMLLGTLFLIGVRLRLLVVPVLLGAGAFALAAVTSENRMQRIGAFLSHTCDDYINSCWQTEHGTFALANGGVFGVGLGNSTAKWSWLPAADNDFIFAIIGEELGLIGAVVVLGLLVVLAIAFARIMRQAPTMFGRTVTAAMLVWVIGQACVNIGVVLGVFPVLGVPLPLVSSGGTALLTTLVGIGVVLSVARESAPVPARARKRATAR